MRSFLNQFKDLLERAVWTFVQTFAGLLLVSGITSIDNLDTAFAAGAAAALSVLKSVAGHKLNGTPQVIPFTGN